VPRISAKRQQDRRQAILDGARVVFSSRGFESASIGEIATASGVSDGLVYRYFKNKRDLLVEVLGEFYLRVIDDLEAVVAKAGGFREQLSALVETHLGLFVSDRGLCRLFLIEIRVESDYRTSPIYRLNRRYTSILLRVVESGIKEGVVHSDIDPRLIRDLLFGGIEHLAWRHLDQAGPFEHKVDAARIAEILLHGITRA